MRGTLIVVSLAAILAAAAPPAAGAGHDCGPRAAHTVERNRFVRVFYRRTSAGNRNYFACLRGSSRRSILLVYRGIKAPDTVSRFLLRGRYVAFVYRECPRPGDCFDELTRLDVRSREDVTVQVLPGSIGTIVATRAGAVGFVATDGGPDFSIQKLDSLGVSEIDRGPDVRSLTLRGTRLHWLNGTVERSEPAAHQRRCGPISKFIVTQALSRSARVYTEYDDSSGDRGETYACLLPGGKPLLLGDGDTSSTAYWFPAYFQLAGEHVVWLGYDCFTDCHARLHSADLQKRTIRSGMYLTAERNVLINGQGFATELFRDDASPPSYTLLAFDSQGERKVDTGPGIDPASLSIDESAMSWRHDGEGRSEELR